MNLKLPKQKIVFKKNESSALNYHMWWKVFILSSFFALIILGSTSLWLFYSINNAKIFQMPPPAASLEDAKNKSKLDSIIKTFADKKAKSDSIIANPPIYVDPSL